MSQNTSTSKKNSVETELEIEPKGTALIRSEGQALLALLQQRFSRVSYLADENYEIDGRIRLSAAEARSLIEGQVTLEEIVIYRHRPSHLMPMHVRLALCRTPPLK